MLTCQDSITSSSPTANKSKEASNDDAATMQLRADVVLLKQQYDDLGPKLSTETETETIVRNRLAHLIDFKTNLIANPVTFAPKAPTTKKR